MDRVMVMDRVRVTVGQNGKTKTKKTRVLRLGVKVRC